MKGYSGYVYIKLSIDGLFACTFLFVPIKLRLFFLFIVAFQEVPLGASLRM